MKVDFRTVGGLVEPLHADVFVADDAAGVVGLEGEGAFVKLAGELRAGLLSAGSVYSSRFWVMNSRRAARAPCFQQPQLNLNRAKASGRGKRAAVCSLTKDR